MEKKIFKRILTTFILALFLTIGLTGCGENKEGEKNKVNENKGGDSLNIEEILKKSENVSEIKYDFVTSGLQEGGIKTTIARKGDKMKFETDMNGMKSAYYIDYGEKTAYTYMPQQNMAIKTDFGKVEKMVNDSPAERIQSFDTSDIKVSGREKIEGKDCVIIEQNIGEGQAKIWVWEEKGLPLKTEIDGPAGKMITELKNIETKVDDKDVELPEGATEMETPGSGNMPNIDMGNIPGM